MKSFIKSIIALTPYRVLRGPSNRFQAFAEGFDLLRKMAYRPGVIIDGGAHMGDFARQAKAAFPEAAIHLIEPQRACRDALERLAATGGFVLHPYALVTPEERANRFIRLAAGDTPSTGAHILPAGDEGHSEQAETATLDELFAEEIRVEQRVLLKLDLQGYELMALRGAAVVLRAIEVVLVEVSFFAQAYEPPIPALMRFLDDKGFELFDIASLSGRTRDNRLRQGDFIFVRRGSVLLADGRWE